MRIYSFARPVVAIITLVVFSFISCDDEISDFGSEAIIGTEIQIIDTTFTNINTQQISTSATQANNLPYNLLGEFDGENYNAKYHILGQLFGVTNSFSDSELNSSTVITVTDDDGVEDIVPEFVTTTKYNLINVKLVIPYRYSVLGDDEDDIVDEDENTDQYTIESNIFGNENGSISIKVKQNNFFLNSTGPDTTNPTVYFSDGTSPTALEINLSGSEDQNIIDDMLVTNGIYEINLQTINNNSGITIDNTKTATDTNNGTRIIDGETFNVINVVDDTLDNNEIAQQFNEANGEVIRIPLSSTFKDTIINLITNEDGEVDLGLLSSETITDEFRGIYIETQDEESSPGVIEVMGFNEGPISPGIEMTFSKEEITNFYDNSDPENIDTIEIETVFSTFLMNTSTNRAINLIEDIAVDTVEEDNDTILLQSGMGSVGFLELFNNELDEVRNLFTLEDEMLENSNILLNDAELVLTVKTENTDLTRFFDGESTATVLGEGQEVPSSDEDADINYSNIMITQVPFGNVLSDYASNEASADIDQETSLQKTHLIPLQELNGELVYRINITEYLATILNISIEEDDDIMDNIIESELLKLIISPTNDIIQTGFTQINKDGIEIDTGISTENLFINQGAVLSFKTIPIYSSNATDENKRPRLNIKYTSTK